MWKRVTLPKRLSGFYIANESAPLEVRRCLVNFVKEQHQQGQFRLAREAEYLLLVCGAGRCGDDEALLYFGRLALQQMGVEFAPDQPDWDDDAGKWVGSDSYKDGYMVCQCHAGVHDREPGQGSMQRQPVVCDVSSL